jgi:SpoVK/Ycf46/Vps4 family AAA+-type ATPase
MKKLYFFAFLLFHSFFKTQTIEKQLSPNDIKNLATEIFNQYIETIRTTTKPLNKKEILITASISVITPGLGIFIGYKAIHTDFSDLIRNIFTSKNSLKIDESKKQFLLPLSLNELKLNNEQDKFILFYGPPGTGKSFGVSVLAAQQNAFYKETDGNIFNVESLVGTDITKINTFFETLKKLSLKNQKQKIVACINEFESIGDRDDAKSQENNRVNCAVNLMLNKMDEIKEKFKNVYIIFTTNYKEKIDKALLSRCTVQVPFELPSIEMIQKILQTNFRDFQEKNRQNYIELIKNNINKKNTEEKNLNINDLICKASNYDEEKNDFWFGSLDLEITKTDIEVLAFEKEEDANKKEISVKKNKILTDYKTKLVAEEDFYKFFAILAHLHQFNLRDVNSLIEKKNEVHSQDNFIKMFSDKITSKGFVRKKIHEKDKTKIALNAKAISFNELEKKINTLEANLIYS